MELRDAVEKANQILEEERASPTVRYTFNAEATPPDTLKPLAHLVAAVYGPQELQRIRSERPRSVIENPRQWVLDGSNYTLLCALRSQLPEKSQRDFVNSVLLRIVNPPGCAQSKKNPYPAWNGLISELPLVAEFCVRNGAKEGFFRVVAEANPMPGHVILLRHLEDMIALDFTVFSDSEYQQLALSVSSFRATAERQPVPYYVFWSIRCGIYGVDATAQREEIIAAAHGIEEECRKARYLYLKASLLEGLNLEVNQDKESVDSYLRSLGFSPTLIECLNQADRLYREAGDAFSLKSSMGHLRSFLEKLHAEALPAVNANVAGPVSEKWGDGLVYLRSTDVLSKAEGGFVAGLYTLISDEAVHPLIAEREYARLARNVVIEYALLFLRKLEKLRAKVKAP
jgi:hypothetical protein